MEAERDNSKPPNEGEGEIGDGDMEESDGQKRVRSDCSTDCAVEHRSEGESKADESETLTSVQLSEGDFQVDCDECSRNLSEVPVKYSLQFLQLTGELKDQERTEPEQPSVGNKDQSAKVQIQLHDDSSKLKLSLTSVSQCTSSEPTQVLQEEKVQLIENEDTICHTGEHKQNLAGPNYSPAVFIPKPTTDGYNWRKYGQKQVKSPEGSRSYYRCTFSDCCAKKIEFCDHYNCLVETVYRSHHNHDPPKKVNCAKLNRLLLSTAPVERSNDTSCLAKCVNDPVTSSLKEPLGRVDELPEAKQQESGASSETMDLDKKESVSGPEFQKRKRRQCTGKMESNSQPGKTPKYVVYGAGDAGVSVDGYRWRKYGQKMVKNNPHPRNYYRCTSSGCPVRKHIERAVDNSRAVIITYKGIHDHNTPLPRKRHGLSNAHATATSTIVASDKEGELSGEEVKESGERVSKLAGTLLSVGFEIKPC